MNNLNCDCQPDCFGASMDDCEACKMTRGYYINHSFVDTNREGACREPCETMEAFDELQRENPTVITTSEAVLINALRDREAPKAK